MGDDAVVFEVDFISEDRADVEVKAKKTVAAPVNSEAKSGLSCGLPELSSSHAFPASVGR